MRTLKRNRRKIYYKLYTGKAATTDVNRRRTGWAATYGSIQTAYVNVSSGNAEAEAREFGITVEHDRKLVYEVGEYPFDENTILWVDQTDTSKPHDYICKAPMVSLNSVTLPIKRVDVSG